MHVFVRQSVFLLATVSSLTLLSACDKSPTTTMRELITGERARTPVEGGRRLPLHNSQYVAANQESPPQAAEPMVTQSAPAPSTPYDEYDEYGNHIGTVTPAPVAERPAATETASASETVSSSGESSGGNFFSRLFGFGDSSRPDPQEARKPLPGNPYPIAGVPAESTAIADEPELIAQAHDPVELPAPLLADASASADEATYEPETVSSADDEPSDSKPSWFARLFGSDKEDAVSAEQEAQTAEFENQPYPKLSSVGATPEHFQEIKQQKAATMQELYEDHELAQMEKAELDGQPSQQAPMTPITTQTQHSASFAETETPGEPVVLGHASLTDEPYEASFAETAPVIETPEPRQAAVSSQPEAPVAMVETELTESEESQPQASQTASRQNWWEGWGGLFSSRDDEQPAPQAAAPADRPVEPVAAAPLPTLVPEYAPIASVSAYEPVEETSSAYADDSEGALPSPRILQEVRTMRPSRYEARRRVAH